MIPPHMAVMAPILVSETVMTLKAARFLISVFRAFAANQAAKAGLRRLKIDEASFKLQRAYAYAETLIEVRIMNMLSLAGVIGVLWMLDVPSGRTAWLLESAYAATAQLFVHLMISSVALFFPDALTKILLECSEYPPRVVNVITVILLTLDATAHVANAAFVATALRNKTVAGAIFIFSVMLYKTIDKGLIALGNTIKTKIDRELQELKASGEPIPVPVEDVAFEEDESNETERKRTKGRQQSKGKKKRS